MSDPTWVQVDHGLGGEVLVCVFDADGHMTLSDDQELNHDSVGLLIRPSGSFKACIVSNPPQANAIQPNPSGKPSYVVYRPTEPKAVWEVHHNLHTRPIVQVRDPEGRKVLVEVHHESADVLFIRHKTPMGGKAVCFPPIQS